MGTKNAPGKFDCYTKAHPDEPMFVLLGRDEHAPEVVRYWVALKAGVPPLGACSEVPAGTRATIPEKHREALDCADAMAAWRANEGKQ